MSLNAKQWDEAVAKKTGWCHFLQSAEWAAAQQHTAWQPDLTEVNDYPLALYHRPVAGIGKIYMAGKLATLKPNQVAGFTKGLRKLAGGGVLVKIDIDQLYDEKLHETLLKQGWLSTPSPNYSDTVLVDLTKGRDALLASFKKDTRWEINAGLRRGVKVKKVPLTAANIKTVYDLLSQTYERADFFTRGRAFTEKYWRLFDETGQGSMFIANCEGKPLSAAYVIHIGKRAHYKDGASIRVKPDVFASRVMQWAIMEHLIKQGVETYDLGGVWRSGSGNSGVTLFKTGFGEHVKTQWGYELPLKPGKYKLWKRFGERLALQHAAKIRKELWY
jgi:lipid II:glycine glycyltransferase (peptidoglycan interpeptide bridge formation enzyme)